MKSPASQGKAFDIKVAPDRLSATLHVAAGPAGAAVSIADVRHAADDLKLARIDEKKLIAILERRGADALDHELARGVAPAEERPGDVEFCVQVASSLGVSITVVEAGQLLAKTTPGTPGRAGRDVFGEPIPPPPVPQPFVAGRGVVVADGRAVAESRGSLRRSGPSLSVEPLLEVAAGDDSPIAFEGDAHVRGSIGDGRAAQVGGSLLVDGDVGAAQVRVKGAMQIAGGLIGNGRGRCTTGGDLWCGFITGGNVNAQGHVRVLRGDVTQSLIYCGKSVELPSGSLSGGRVIANGGVSCSTLGNEHGEPTVLEIGTDAMVAALFGKVRAEIESLRERGRRLRAQVEPQIREMKQLTHREKETVTEVLSEAGEAEDRAGTLEQQVAAQAKRLRASEELKVVVHEVMHPGVSVRIGDCQAVVATRVVGPLTLMCAPAGATPGLVIVDGRTGQSSPLPTPAVAAAA